jgi:hypothetical protein
MLQLVITEVTVYAWAIASHHTLGPQSSGNRWYNTFIRTWEYHPIAMVCTVRVRAMTSVTPRKSLGLIDNDMADL